MNRTINILIVEDEPLAAAQLAALIAGINPQAKIVAVCDTIESTLNWIEKNETPDLAFFDIHLGDGLSFEIFKRSSFNVPIIFTTAYDQYSIKAFKVNSIDYLLKPIEKEELKNALAKFDQNTQISSPNFSNHQLKDIIQSIHRKEYKSRFLVKIGNHLKAINTDTISFIYSFQKGTFIKCSENKNYLIDQTLEQVEQVIDPNHFFRINRKYIVALDAIIDVAVYSNSRLKLKIKYADEDDFFVSREKVKAFKNWLEGDEF